MSKIQSSVPLLGLFTQFSSEHRIIFLMHHKKTRFEAGLPGGLEGYGPPSNVQGCVGSNPYLGNYNAALWAESNFKNK